MAPLMTEANFHLHCEAAHALGDTVFMLYRDEGNSTRRYLSTFEVSSRGEIRDRHEWIMPAPKNTLEKVRIQMYHQMLGKAESREQEFKNPFESLGGVDIESLFGSYADLDVENSFGSPGNFDFNAEDFVNRPASNNINSNLDFSWPQDYVDLSSNKDHWNSCVDFRIITQDTIVFFSSMRAVHILRLSVLDGCHLRHCIWSSPLNHSILLPYNITFGSVHTHTNTTGESVTATFALDDTLYSLELSLGGGVAEDPPKDVSLRISPLPTVSPVSSMSTRRLTLLSTYGIINEDSTVTVKLGALDLAKATPVVWTAWDRIMPVAVRRRDRHICPEPTATGEISVSIGHKYTVYVEDMYYDEWTGRAVLAACDLDNGRFADGYKHGCTTHLIVVDLFRST
jgi:hypothetical protein